MNRRELMVGAAVTALAAILPAVATVSQATVLPTARKLLYQRITQRFESYYIAFDNTGFTNILHSEEAFNRALDHWPRLEKAMEKVAKSLPK